jgi:hypothetical protein
VVGVGFFDELGPSDADLAAIEAEWPVLAAELDLVDAEIDAVRRPSHTARVRVRRAEAGLVLALLDHLNSNQGTSHV